MNIVGAGKRVRIYVGESDQWRAGPLYLAVLERLRAEGCAGATVIRGTAGFGANSRIHTATILRLSEDLPIVIEWVDAPDRVERVLPAIKEMVKSGLITVDDVQIVHYQHRPVADIGNRLRVREVMTRDVASVHSETPLRDAVLMLVGSEFRALPVVDTRNHLVGLVANTELIERGGLGLRVESLGTLSSDLLAEQLKSIEEGKTVADVMVREVTTIPPEATLSEAAHLMVVRSVKRLPVVDPSGLLLGMVSRADLLRTAVEGYPRPAEEGPMRTGKTVGEIMRADIPMIRPEAPLPEVIDAVVSTPLSRAFVVDDAGHLLGVVSDAELTRRLSPKDRPSAMRILMGRLPFGSLPPEERRLLERAAGTTAGDLMVAGTPVISAETPVSEAIRAAISERRRLLAVVDPSGRLLGAVHRSDLLRILATAFG
jgi:CBS domain-containing protein